MTLKLIIGLVLLWTFIAVITAPFWLDEIFPKWRTAGVEKHRRAVKEKLRGKRSHEFLPTLRRTP